LDSRGTLVVFNGRQGGYGGLDV